jgi:hypothetical protein
MTSPTPTVPAADLLSKVGDLVFRARAELLKNYVHSADYLLSEIETLLFVERASPPRGGDGAGDEARTSDETPSDRAHDHSHGSPSPLPPAAEAGEPTPGWQLVPIEPTVQMVEDGRATLSQGERVQTHARVMWVWEAMLKAAPPSRRAQPIQGAGEGREEGATDWKRRYEDEYAIVARIWTMLGVTTYGDAGGKSIYEFITELQARPAAPPTFWVVERFENGKSAGYWDGGHSRSFQPDIEKAVHYCRREDAFWSTRGWHWDDIQLTEHAYIASPPPPAPAPVEPLGEQERGGAMTMDHAISLYVQSVPWLLRQVNNVLVPPTCGCGHCHLCAYHFLKSLSSPPPATGEVGALVKAWRDESELLAGRRQKFLAEIGDKMAAALAALQKRSLEDAQDCELAAQQRDAAEAAVESLTTSLDQARAVVEVLRGRVVSFRQAAQLAYTHRDQCSHSADRARHEASGNAWDAAADRIEQDLAAAPPSEGGRT